MKLRTRLDVFSAALLSALGATQVVACGGSATLSPGDPKGSAGDGSGNANSGGTSAGSATSGGTSAGNATSGGTSAGNATSGGTGAGSATSGGTSSGGASSGGASTGGSGQSGAGNAGSAGTGSGNRFPCTNPKDLGNGLIQCDGFKHRKQAGTCASQLPRPDAIPDPGMVAACKFDADCTAEPHGWCAGPIQGNIASCEYGCVKDSECAANQVCDCREPVGRCVPADCASDADCASGFLCKAHDSTGGCEIIRYSCQAAADTCGSDLDCAGGAHCRQETTPGFRCIPGICAIGRPFLIDGLPRLAQVNARSDWNELAPLPNLADLDAALRAQLAAQWTCVALMEHASIAAFARFALQLMSLGAPASLLERTTAAMADETKHAKACFAVASHYAGTALGPGRLAIERSLDDSSLQEIVLNAIREGCVGETVAAIEAREAAEHALDPALRELLQVIAEDETRHAELAYRFVKWALATSGPELEQAVRREFEALASEAPPPRSAPPESEAHLLRHGIVPQAMREAIRRQAIAEVILPCSRALFAGRATAQRLATASI
jgi:hypothetical protein